MDDSAASDPVERLMVACLELPEDEREAAIEKARAENPALAEELQERWAALQRLGLDGSPLSSGEEFPERLGDFRLIARLGAGGMGVVFRAEQVSLGREVALKLLRSENLFFQGSRERFRREVEAVARLKHPGIVPVHAVGEEQGIPFFAMELVEGATLAGTIERLVGRSPERLTGADVGAQGAFEGSWVDAALELVRQVAEALHHAHEHGIVHRDVKPSNVALTRDGRAQLLDFGLAGLAGVDKMTRTGSTLGTLHYMSPEQLRGAADVDVRTDVYSLGVTLYELLTLETPFRGKDRLAVERAISAGRPDSLRARNRRVPSELELVCAKAMDVDPARRYASARDLAEDLRRVLERRPVIARAPGPVLRAKRWTQRRPALAVGLVAGLGLFVVAPSFLLWREQQHSAALSESLAAESRALAAERAALAESIAAFEFLEGVVFAATPQEARGREVLVSDLFEDIVRRIDELADQPRLQARMLISIGLSLNALERYEDALDLIERGRAMEDELGGSVMKPGYTLHALANVYDSLGRFEESEELALAAVDELERAGLGGTAQVANALTTAASANLHAYDYARGEELLLEALRVHEAAPVPDAEHHVTTALLLANARRGQNRAAEDLGMLTDLLARAERELPTDHPIVVGILDSLSTAHLASGDFEAALRAEERAVELGRRLHGERSATVAIYQFHLARLLWTAGQREDAVGLMAEATEIMTESAGPEDPTVLSMRAELEQSRALLDR